MLVPTESSCWVCDGRAAEDAIVAELAVRRVLDQKVEMLQWLAGQLPVRIAACEFDDAGLCDEERVRLLRHVLANVDGVCDLLDDIAACPSGRGNV